MASARQVIIEFIEKYKNLPWLWDLQHDQYHNRELRRVSYDKLTKILRKADPTANRNACVRKINNLRCSLRKETRKIEKSILAGKTGDDAYKSRLWYYDRFDFLDKPNKFDQTKTTTAMSKTPQSIMIKLEESNENYSDIEEVMNDETESNMLSSENDIVSLGESNTQFELNAINNNDIDHNPTAAKMTTLTPTTMLDGDRWHFFGMGIATKLRNLERKKGLVAENMINDILFEAEYGNLKLSQFVSGIGDD